MIFCAVRKIKRVILTSGMMFYLGCAEKPAQIASSNPNNTAYCLNDGTSSTSQSNTSSSQQNNGVLCQQQNDPNNPTNPNGGSGDSDLCSVLSQDSFLASRFSAFINSPKGLCSDNQKLLNTLRSEEYAYMGREDSPPRLVIHSNVVTTNYNDNLGRSDMQAYGAFHTPASPLSYFELMKMKIDTPDVFRSKFPENLYDSKNVSYTKISGDVTNGVLYRYTNSSGDVGDVDYEATARFLTLVPNKIYVVTSQFEKKHDMVDGTRGLTIINQIRPGVSEIIGISDQRFENGDNHEAAIDDAKKNLEREMNYNFRQALYKHNTLDKGN